MTARSSASADLRPIAAGAVPPTGHAIAVRGLTKSYGQAEVLSGIDLAIGAATLTAVVGSNGAGKSTLLGCIAGVLRHGGAIETGTAARSSAPSRLVYLPQRVRLPGGATVDEVLRLFRSLSGAPADRVDPPAGFLPGGDRRIGELSGGQAQRVALAATLVGTPDLILLDEPLANLDDGARDVVRDLIRAHREAGATILIANPAAFELLADADQVIRIEAGRVVYQGPARHYLADLRSTVWVLLEPGQDEASLSGIAGVHRAVADGRWQGLDCRGRDVTAVVSALRDRGITGDRIRVGGSGDPEADRGAGG